MEDYGFLSFALNMGKYISKIFSKHYNQKLIALAKISATVTIKTASKEYFKKTAAEIHYKVIKKQLKVKQNIEKYQKNIYPLKKSANY